MERINQLLIVDSAMTNDADNFKEQFKENMKKLEQDLPKLKQDLDSLMEKYGSVELMSNLAIQELFAQNPLTHDPNNPLGENPFFAFLLGLFLTKNRLDAGEPHPDHVAEVLDSVNKYFENFKWFVSSVDIDEPKSTDFLIFLSRQKKFLDDLNSHCYPEQKEDYVTKVFSVVDYFLQQKYGFNSNDTITFYDKIADKIGRSIHEKWEYVNQLVESAKKQFDENEDNEFIKKWKERGWNKEQLINFYGNTHFLANAKDILIINVTNFCESENIEDSIKFRKYLETLSCKFGQQVQKFENPLSDNLLFYKPLIQLDEDNFFCPKPDFLIYRLDSILEYLVQDDENAWKKYNDKKSVYLEDKSYEFFSRLFPEECLHRNLYFRCNDERFECDLLLQYDNKIFIIESKSSHLPLSAKRGGINSLRDSLKDIVRKAYRQGQNVRSYIKSDVEVKFENKAGDVVFTLKSMLDDEFFIINVTTENLGPIGTNLKRLDVFEFFQQNDYPWSANLYDLDIITDCILEPSFFIHYLEQRIRAQKEDIFESIEEIDFFGYYYQIGNFYAELLSSENTASIMIMPEFYGVLDNCYLFDKPKPKLVIPKKLDELIKNMQKYRQRGFTKITSVLLDFPQEQRKLLAKALEDKFNKTVKTGRVDGKTMAIPAPYDVGFSYFTSPTMTKEFYQLAKSNYKKRKYQQKITRWAVIGRNVSDKKNFATFFIYDDAQWIFNQEMNDEVESIFGSNIDSENISN